MWRETSFYISFVPTSAVVCKRGCSAAFPLTMPQLKENWRHTGMQNRKDFCSGLKHFWSPCRDLGGNWNVNCCMLCTGQMWDRVTHSGLSFVHLHTLTGTAGTVQLDTQLCQGAEIFLLLSSASWKSWYSHTSGSWAAVGLVNKAAVMENKSSPNKCNEKPHAFQQIDKYRKTLFFFFLTHRGMFFLFLFFETNKTKPRNFSTFCSLPIASVFSCGSS